MLPAIRRRLRRAKETLQGLYRVYQGARLQPGTKPYARRAQEEIEHYSEVFAPEQGAVLEPAPPVWEEIQRRSADLLRRSTGHDLTGHVVSRLASRPGARLLSLGSGAGGVEMVFAREVPAAAFICFDLNPNLLRIGEEAAAGEGLPIRFEQADLNTVVLPRREFDVVFCHASLHHVLELERLAEQIRNALRPGGELIVVDIATRSGYRMWPETRKVVRALFRTLPARYRLNHTAYLPEKRVDRDIWEGDTRRSGMECIRSEDVIPILANNFQQKLFVPYQSISRRFFDTMYGPNYDLTKPLDAAIVDWIWELDCYYLAEERLKPESFFAVYAP